MPPAFSSTKQAAAFALLLAALLAAPWISAQGWTPHHPWSYASEGKRWEEFPYAQKFVYGETNDIDIVFIGSSRISYAVDTTYVQHALDERLGRKSVVRTIGWASGGFDGLYFFAKDLLEHRRVKTLVFQDETTTGAKFQEYVSHWIQYGDSRQVLSRLSMADQAVYYLAAIVATPRDLAEWISPSQPKIPGAVPSILSLWWVVDPATRLGCCTSRGTWDWPTRKITPRLTPFFPQTGVTSADVLTYTPETASKFKFSNTPKPEMTVFFARQFAQLAKKHNCNLVALHIPIYDEKDSSVITEARNWAELMQTDITLMGIPTGRLFNGLSATQVNELYANPLHLNENGQRYFTTVITPALIQNYENHLSN